MVLRINSQEEVNPKYLHWCLKGKYLKGETFKLQSKTTGLHNLDFKGFLRLEIPLLPIETQRQIVSELDLLGTIISKKKQQLAELDRLAAATFHEMFGDPVENEKQWPVKKLGEICNVGSGGTPSKAVPEYWENGNIPWIGSNMCQNVVIYETDGKFITEEGLNNSSAKLLEKDTVLVALVGATIGKVALLKCKTATNQNIAFIDVNSNQNLIAEYLFYDIMGLYDLFMGIGDGKFKMANLSFIRNLPINIPPLPLQQTFAEKISQLESLKEKIKQSLAATQTLLAATMDKYFG